VAASDNAVWDVTLALRAVQLGLGYRVGTVGARFQWFLNLTLVWFPMHACGRVSAWMNKKLKHKIVPSSCA